LSPTVARARSLAVLLGTAAAVFGLDHLTKWLVVQHLGLGDQWPSSGPVTIHHIQNRGAAFGLFPQLQTVFLVVAVLVSVYIIVAGPRFAQGLWAQVTLGAILGGAVGNAVDRFAQGYVVDFVDLHRWPVFNLADSAIVVGIVVAVFTFGGGPGARDRVG
jgi:signal peptidase II